MLCNNQSMFSNYLKILKKIQAVLWRRTVLKSFFLRFNEEVFTIHLLSLFVLSTSTKKMNLNVKYNLQMLLFNDLGVTIQNIHENNFVVIYLSIMHKKKKKKNHEA